MKKKNKELGPLDDLNGQLMIMAAHRYCLGRQSYIVPSCVDWLKKWWEKFENNTKAVIIRDTVTALQDNTAGASYDTELWNDFAQWGYDKLNEESKQWCQQAVAYKNKPWPLSSQCTWALLNQKWKAKFHPNT